VAIGYGYKAEKDATNLRVIFTYQNIGRMTPKGPPIVSGYRTFQAEAEEVFSRHHGCENLSPLVARASMRFPVSPRLIAAVIVRESSCNPNAVSSKGACGLMQVHIAAWSHKYDFSSVNPFNKQASIMVGTEILSDLIQQYGVENALRRYNGTGIGMDVLYTKKVMSTSRSKK